MVQTPVLFETFVRVEYARQVWDAIKAAQPKKLYFYSNKGREEKEGEVERNNEIRSWVNEIDWNCELHTFFRDECVDIYSSLKGAIDWVFSNEPEAIILEDDCVPCPAFFSFCDQMIEYYRDDMRVWNVSGDNFYNINPGGYDYIFSHFHWMYGWATWRNRWQAIDWDDFGIDAMIQQRISYHLFRTKAEGERRHKQLIRIKDFVERTKCWDFVFGIVSDQHGAMEVVPTRHLITNIGMSGEHHKNDSKSIFNVECTETGEVYYIRKRPPFVFPDSEFDYFIFREIYVKSKPLWKRVVLKVLKTLRIEKTIRTVQQIFKMK